MPITANPQHRKQTPTPHNINEPHSIFPSYRRIQYTIIQNEYNKARTKVRQLQAHLQQMDKHRSIDKAHEELQRSLCVRYGDYMNNNCEIIDKQGILGRGDMTWEISYEDEGRQESLNCYLQEDQSQYDDFEMLLKLRKVALERYIAKQEKGEHDKNKEREREREKEIDKYQKKCKEKKYSREPYTIQDEKLFHYLFQSTKLFPNSKGQNSNTDAEVERYNVDKCSQQNKQLLLTNYMPILLKLQHTNIVKWRILNNY